MCLEKLNKVIDCDYAMLWGFPGGSDGKESACNARNPGLMPGLDVEKRELSCTVGGNVK